MNPSHPLRRPMAAIGLCIFALTGTAMAGNGPDPTHLPRCHSLIEADTTCRLPLKNGNFDSLEGWQALGRVTLLREANNAYASLASGSSLQQAVYAMYYKWGNAAYALRFRARSHAGNARLHVAMFMSDSSGRYTRPIGSMKATATEGAWRTFDLVANGKPTPAPAHVLIEITNVDEPDALVDVDDVYLVESADAEAVEVP